MKKLFKIIGVIILFVTIASFSSLSFKGKAIKQNSSSDQTLVKALQGVRAPADTAYFNSKQCIINAGFTWTGVTKMLPSSQILTCIE